MSVTVADITAASARVRGRIVRTPLLRNSELESTSGLEFLGWKCENLQTTGSFKVRGATNAVGALLEASKASPPSIFVTHSSGNHGQALAFACKSFGSVAHVVVPKNAPKVKIAGLKRLGARVEFCEPTQKAREAACEAALKREGANARLVHPYDDDLVIAGQGTLGMEIIEDTEKDGVDVFIVPVGGGGLISGTATAIKALRPNAKVIGAEPLNADDAARSFGAKSTAPLPHRDGMPNTIADGLRGQLSQRTLAIIRNQVDQIYDVTEDEIREAMRLVFDNLKLVIEPSAGVGAAVALLPRFAERRKGWKRVVVVLCGGNVDLDELPSFLPKL